MILAISVATTILTDTASKYQAAALDLAEIQHVKYGLLDASHWAAAAGKLVNDTLEKLSSDPQNAEVLRPLADVIVNAVVDGVQTYLIEELAGVKPGKKPGLWAKGKRFAINKAFEKGVHPSKLTMSNKLLESVRQKNGEVHKLIRKSLTHLRAQTHHNLNRKKLEVALERHGCTMEQSTQCQAIVEGKLSRLNRKTYRLTVGVILAFLLYLVWCCSTRRSLTHLDVIILLVGLGVLMVGGVQNPMMTIEAKIDELSFVVLGEPFTFTNQVVFFQSKSIIDVVDLLITGNTLDLVLVGVMIALFSVGFPSLKLVASCIYHFDWGQKRRHRLVRFFALKSGKWSMADVFVIALFMAFIGFSGIIDSQLGQLSNGEVSQLRIAPHHGGTSFRSGFYLFTAFCIASIVVTTLIGRMSLERSMDPETHLVPLPNSQDQVAGGPMVQCINCEEAYVIQLRLCPRCGHSTLESLTHEDLVRLFGQKTQDERAQVSTQSQPKKG